MSEELEKAGLYIDESCLLRVLQPEITNETKDLRNECLKFNESNCIFFFNNLFLYLNAIFCVVELSEFKKIADVFIALADNYAKLVEVAKLKALSTLNTFNSMTKKREQEQQKIQSLLIELMIELDRLKINYQFLSKIEAEQA
ncbi:intraflagellar transport protein 20 homolog [Culicoides brevitarsis]|uniref:intraflagellar transport protein 20 homolog n=1 Tax=Culicoides brevitarsis TaxID=469753 RepID=UPI00307C5007